MLEITGAGAHLKKPKSYAFGRPVDSHVRPLGFPDCETPQMSASDIHHLETKIWTGSSPIYNNSKCTLAIFILMCPTATDITNTIGHLKSKRFTSWPFSPRSIEVHNRSWSKWRWRYNGIYRSILIESCIKGKECAICCWNKLPCSSC